MALSCNSMAESDCESNIKSKIEPTLAAKSYWLAYVKSKTSHKNGTKNQNNIVSKPGIGPESQAIDVQERGRLE